MNISKSAGLTVVVLTLAGACTSAQVRPMDAPPGSPTTAAGGVDAPNVGLARYVGEYNFPEFTMMIRLRGETLIRQVAGQPEQVLRPISATRFRIGDTPVELTFIIDKEGEVTELVMGSGSHTMRGHPARKR